METVFEENPCGGIGRMKLEKILDHAQMNGKCGLFARVTIPVGEYPEAMRTSSPRRSASASSSMV